MINHIFQKIKGSIFEIKGDYEIVNLIWQDENGKTVNAMTKDGIPLKTIQRVI